MSEEKQLPEEFTDEWWKVIGQTIASMGIEENKKIHTAWLRGKKLKVGATIVIGSEKPPQVTVKLKSTTDKVDSETTILEALPLLENL